MKGTAWYHLSHEWCQSCRPRRRIPTHWLTLKKKGPKHTHLFEGPTTPLFTYVDIDITHMITGLLPPFLQMVSDQKLDGGKAWELCYIWCTLSEQLLLSHGAGLVFNLRAWIILEIAELCVNADNVFWTDSICLKLVLSSTKILHSLCISCSSFKLAVRKL